MGQNDKNEVIWIHDGSRVDFYTFVYILVV